MTMSTTAPRGPALAVDLHAADTLVVGDAFEDEGPVANERRGASAQSRGHPLVAQGQWAQRAEHQDR